MPILHERHATEGGPQELAHSALEVGLTWLVTALFLFFALAGLGLALSALVSYVSGQYWAQAGGLDQQLGLNALATFMAVSWMPLFMPFVIPLAMTVVMFAAAVLPFQRVGRRLASWVHVPRRRRTPHEPSFRPH